MNKQTVSLQGASPKFYHHRTINAEVHVSFGRRLVASPEDRTAGHFADRSRQTLHRIQAVTASFGDAEHQTLIL
jgi:hypothetical protein